LDRTSVVLAYGTVVKAVESKNGRKWLRLVPMTWVPFDPALIDKSLLEPAERSWLDDYHRECVEKLSPLLPVEDREALRNLLDVNETRRPPSAAAGPGVRGA
jgi:hypothetical protein